MIGGYRYDVAKQIYERVLGVKQGQPAIDEARHRTTHNQLYYVEMQSDLSAAADALTGYTQADGRIVRYKQPVQDDLDMELSSSSEAIIPITNRTSFTASEGDVILVIRNGSEWSPLGGEGLISHAKITACIGGGYYEAVLSLDDVWEPPDYNGTGTIGYGTGTGNDCDLCAEFGTGSADAGVCATFVEPSRQGVNGGGLEIIAYDPRLLPMQAGAHIIVARMSNGQAAGTGSGTATRPEVWFVLTGNYPLLAIPDKTYACCNGTVTLIQCDYYITEGYFCSGVPTTCPGTGTAAPP